MSTQTHSTSLDELTRQQLCDSLRYPCWLVLQHTDLDQCTHAGHYYGGDPACWHCEIASECRWRNYFEDPSTTLLKSDEEVLAALRLAVDYVYTVVGAGGHNTRRCSCEGCIWLREASQLEERVSREMSR